MVCLFDGCLAASDREFVDCIKTHKDKCDEGEDYMPDNVMTLALNKCKNLSLEDKWNALLPEQEQIVALTSTIEKIEDENLKLPKAGQVQQQQA